MLDIARAFTSVGEHDTAKKALEYAVVFRANTQSSKNQRKIQEFLLQVQKVLDVNQNQKDKNDHEYADLASQ
jgi:uncharacterized membrane protein